MDLFAAEIGMDPVKVRMRNLIRPDQIPYARPLSSTGEPMLFSDGDFPSILTGAGELLRLAGGWNGGKRLVRRSGWASPCSWRSQGSVRGRRERWRSIPTVWCECGPGCSSVGQGLRTVLAQIVADRLQVDHSMVRVELLDTDGPPMAPEAMPAVPL